MQTITTTTSARASRAHDIWRQLPRRLDTMLKPKVIAVVGATEREGTVGRTLIENLQAGGFEGAVYPINPKHESVLGVKTYPNIGSVPDPVDLAIIVTPSTTVPGIVRECAQAGVPGAIIISAGFKETGPAGAALEREILTEARQTGMRIIGPNCLGIMRPHQKLNATFAAAIARPGSVGFISQSGALCTAILDWSFRENVGFSAFISIGSMLDVGWGDLIYYLGDDPHTKSIVIYMESIGDARSFLSAAREVALTKPIIVIKAGRTAAAAKAAASHTGSMTGSDEVLQAAFRRVGVLRVDTVGELFDMAEVLAKQPRPHGPRLAIVTNAGGPAVLATDMLLSSGAQLANLSTETLAALDQFLPPAWSHNNPIDILGDAGPEQYGKVLEITAKDPANDGLLVILTPQAMTDPTGTALQLKKFAKLDGKPILASWMGAGEVEDGEDILNRANIPTFKYPDRAARAFYYMWRYSDNLRALYETPASAPNSVDVSARRERAASIIRQARNSGRTILTEFESKKILAAYDIPTVETHIASNPAEAVEWAEKIGYPVVLKLHSETITHKTDVGGVQLNLRNATDVRRAYKAIKTGLECRVSTLRSSAMEDRSSSTDSAVYSESRITNRASPITSPFLGVTVQPMVRLDGYELILGSSLDSQFGPVLLFGAGGQLVEVFKDNALGLPPLNATLARRLMERTRIYEALKGVRGRKGIDLVELEQLLVRFSQLVVEQPLIAEVDINPLVVSPERLLALDARVLIHSKEVSESQLPKPAIRPYPTQYVKTWNLRNGSPVILRPIRPEDEVAMVTFHKTLSEQSVYYRYFSLLKLPQRIAHERLMRICFNDYDREIALVVERKQHKSGPFEILGVGRLSRVHSTNDAEFALLVSDEWQHLGMGTELLRSLVEIGRNEKLDRIIGYILSENRAMVRVCQKVGFELRHEVESSEYQAVFPLNENNN